MEKAKKLHTSVIYPMSLEHICNLVEISIPIVFYRLPIKQFLGILILHTHTHNLSLRNNNKLSQIKW